MSIINHLDNNDMTFERTCKNCGKVWLVNEWGENEHNGCGSLEKVYCDCGTELYSAYISDGDLTAKLKG
jgi:hypothetical protein